MAKSLKKQIEKKLTKLHKLLDQVDEARIIQADTSETWEVDILANLLTSCQAVIKLLEDKKHPHDQDSWGDPIILEEGLYSLVNAYQEEKTEEEDD